METTLWTLEDYQNRPIEDLFMAVVLECTPSASITDSSAKELASRLAQSIMEHGLSQKRADEIEKIIKEQAEGLEILVSRRIAVALKVGEKYVDVTDDGRLLDKVNGTYIEELEPFGSFYSKEEYSFEQGEDGKIYLEVTSMEPIERYEKEKLS